MKNTTVNGDTLIHPIDEGGMGEVWYAENKLGRKAAVKFLLKRYCEFENVVTRFENEARVMVTLAHPNIVQVFDYKVIDGRPCIIMEYLEGNNLSHRLKEGEHFTQAQLVRWWNEAVAALQYVHDKGIVHRDIKPSNLFITTDGQLKLMDFGFAKLRDSVTGTMTGQQMGTLAYMSPEQIRDSKNVDSRTDLYSLAVAFVHLLTGRCPYDSTTGSDFEIQTSIVNTPLDLAALPPLWKNLLAGYLQKNPAGRPPLRTIANEQEQPPTKPVQVAEETTRIWVQTHKPAESMAGTPEKDESKTATTHSKHKKNNAKWYVLAALPLIAAAIYFLYNTIDHTILQEIDSNMVYVQGGTFVMGSNPSHFKGDNLPVENVSYDDVQEFIRRLNANTGGNYRLPTEIEWEFAARGGTQSNGYKYSGSNNPDNVAWYLNNSGSRTHPVGGKSCNELGIYDMSGNVWEWSHDWYGSYSSGARLAVSSKASPLTRTAKTEGLAKQGRERSEPA